MKTSMNEKIQSIICAVHAYKKHLISYYNFVLGEKNYNWYDETKRFYNTLPLPEGMSDNIACFEAVLSYPIDETLNTEMDELPHKFSFGY